jgi:hypothetical protein
MAIKYFGINRISKAIFFVIFLLAVQLTLSYAQSDQQESKRPIIKIPKISNPPKIDGRLDDDCWAQATKLSNFYKYVPVDGEPASEKTEVLLAYDKENLYVAFRCYDSNKQKIRAHLSKRDTILEDDRVSFQIDTFNNQRRGYYIASNPLGIQYDGFRVEGQPGSSDLDILYHSEGELNDYGYSVEFAIPFKSLRFPPKEVHTIGFQAYRVIPRKNEYSSCPPRDISKNTWFDQMAQIIGLEGIDYSKNIEIFPAFTAIQTGNINDDGIFKNKSPDANFGIGLKYGITPNVTLDFTYNPDFSQVEADAGQVDVNLRYELYFPEKRPFFLEGADIFSTENTVFYSRRIIDPLFGAKITGKVGKTTFGFLSALDEGPGMKWAMANDSQLGEKALFNIIRAKYDLFGNSFIGFLMTSRQFAGRSNQVVAADGSFNFKEKYNFSFQGIQSYTTTEENNKLKDPAITASFSRTSRHLSYSLYYQDLYPDFRIDCGYVHLTDIWGGGGKVSYRFIPNKKWILTVTPTYNWDRWYDHNGVQIFQSSFSGMEFEFPSKTSVAVSFNNDMERWSEVDFSKRVYELDVSSAPTKYLSGGFYLQVGDGIFYEKISPYLGYSRLINGSVMLRPNSRLSEELSLIKSTFWQEKAGKLVYDYNIIRSKSTYQFTKKLFLRTILEYNSYWKELTSDILLSYMHNYGTVFFIGYGGLYDRDELMHLRQNSRSFFIKLSYLWRL